MRKVGVTLSTKGTSTKCTDGYPTQQRLNANSILGSLCENMRHLHRQHHLYQMNQKNLTASLIFTATKKLNPIDEMSIEQHLEGS